MPLKERIPDETKSRIRTILNRIRDNAVELQELSEEMEGVISLLFGGIATRIINLIDLALGEL